MASRNKGRVNTAQGQEMWSRAKRVIPGGGMLLSKRPELFLPGMWPAYFSKASGITVKDLDGNAFQDFSIMGVGCNLLGYSNGQVNRAVFRAIRRGSMSTLNNPAEVSLAEALLGLHPWAEMVRFARSGGEANAIAVRIARAATGRDVVAVCGYHGWHDWYLAVNRSTDQGLDDLLLPGLRPAGVPVALAGSVMPFSHGDLDALRRLAAENDLAAIVVEYARGDEPDLEFLRGVREVASRSGAVLIADECTSGFRKTFGGIHLETGVLPDMAMFGKALGNGFAISAVIGSRAVMQAAEDSFISSTMWTESVGPAAAIATLSQMEKVESWNVVTGLGKLLKAGWRDVADAAGVGIEIAGLDALASFRFTGGNHMIRRTFLTQNMLDRGFLAATTTYLSTAHSERALRRYLDCLYDVFALMARSGDSELQGALRGPIAHDTFRRLTPKGH